MKLLNSFPENPPSAFPVRAGKGTAIVTLYYRPRQKAGKVYEEYRIPYLDANGRHWHYFKNYASARAKGNDMIDQLSRGDADAISLTARDKAIYLRALELLKPLNLSLDSAASQIAEAIPALNGTGSLLEAARFYERHHAKVSIVPLSDAVDGFLQSRKERGVCTEWQANLRRRFKKLKHAFPGLNVSDLTGEDLKKWLNTFEVSNRSWNNNLRDVTVFFNWCKNHRKCLPMTWDELANIHRKKQQDKAITIYTPDELAALFKAATDPNVVVAIAIGAFAGVRTAEIMRLAWEDFRTDKYITVAAEKAKTNQRRIVPIHDNLKLWLAPHRGQGKLFPWTNPNQFHKCLQETGKAAGVSIKRNALRHSYISYRIAENNDVAATALEAGNSPKIIFSNYREIVLPEDAVRWFSIKPAPDGSEEKVIYLAQAKQAAA